LSDLRYKLIVSDLDGTLLNDNAELTARTIEAIRQYHALGGRFTYATGRSDESAKAFADMADMTTPGISFNGAKIIDYADGDVIYETFLGAEEAKAAYAAVRKLNKDAVVYMDDARYVAEYTPVIDKYLERVRHRIQIARDINALIGDGRTLKKLLVIDPNQEEGAILGAVRPIFGDKMNYVKSDPRYFEFLPPGTSKGAALIVLAAHLGVSPAEVVAIGDHLNDVSMIKAAGLGVAVANAEREALDAADYITSSNDEEGVAEFLEKLNRGEEFIVKK
jgi:Cof subfamily protein (haloacid dehalogenase superfamily)